MYSAGEQRVYEPHDHDRLLLSPSAFHDGNFSLLIRGMGWSLGWGGGCARGPLSSCWLGFSLRAAVGDSDEGLYTCNLHHHYCHLYESLAIRLEVTDDRECAPRRPRPSPSPHPGRR
jgi:hypothetical protein